MLAGSDERVEHLNQLLWTYDEASFLPHGSARDGNADRQPVFLTAGEENPNNATMLVLVDGAPGTGLEAFQRVCDMFDGNDEAAVDGGAAALAQRQGRRPCAHLLGADPIRLGEARRRDRSEQRGLNPLG